MEKKMIFIEWLKEKQKVTELLFVLLAIWGIFSYVRRESLGDSLYLVAVWVFVVMIYGVADYMRYRRECLTLQQMEKQVRVSIEPLPKAQGYRQELYQGIMRLMEADKREQLEQREAREKDAMEYFTIWVHQIKTPIAGMSLLLQTSENKEKEEMKGELFYIEQYVDMVLTYLRLGSETNDFVLRGCDVQETVKKAVHKFAGQFIRKKLSLTLEPFSGTVVTDSKWFQFVVEQLLSNAIKYTECGGITISFEKETLCIADTGIGIAPEDLPRIFEKGYTGYNGRMDKKSSGIGLYLCQKTMEKLGGSIWAEAEIGEGSRFYIRFPKGSEKYE